jgi:hypothetical protein
VTTTIRYNHPPHFTLYFLGFAARRMRARTLTALAAFVLGACGGDPRSPGARDGMVRIPAGTFTCGADLGERATLGWEKAAQPAHPVTLREFFIDIHEVTNAEFERFDPTHGRSEASGCDDCPVTDVDWNQARDYCAAQKPPKRLPTEAEWEKAARGGIDASPEPLGDYAWYAKNSGYHAHPVMQKKPNGYGLYDMLGNARVVRRLVGSALLRAARARRPEGAGRRRAPHRARRRVLPAGAGRDGDASLPPPTEIGSTSSASAARRTADSGGSLAAERRAATAQDASREAHRGALPRGRGFGFPGPSSAAPFRTVQLDAGVPPAP